MLRRKIKNIVKHTDLGGGTNSPKRDRFVNAMQIFEQTAPMMS